MTDFVCYGAAQNHRDGIVIRRETHRIFVVDARENRRNYETESSIAKPIPDGPRKYAQSNVAGFAGLLAQPFLVGGGVQIAAV
jgi:hypothetical protein